MSDTVGIFAFDLDSKRAERWAAMVREHSGDPTVDWGYYGGRACLSGTKLPEVAQACEALLPQLFALQEERRAQDFPDHEKREAGWHHWDPDALPHIGAAHQAGRLIGKSFERAMTLRTISTAIRRIVMDERSLDEHRAAILRDFASYLKSIAEDLLERSEKLGGPIPADACRALRHSPNMTREGNCSRCGSRYDVEPLAS